jgi:hypothetical protein
MQIYVTSYDPKVAARHLDDKRVGKVALETAQMLSCAITGKAGGNSEAFKWVCASPGNYRWLFAHYVALLTEYHRRYGKNHKSSHLLDLIAGFVDKLPDGEVTEFPNVTNFQEFQDVRAAYRGHLQYKWSTELPKPTRYGLAFTLDSWFDEL